MLTKPFKLLIGKDINRDTDLCVDGAGVSAFTKTTGIEDGEVLVLDKDKRILAAGANGLDTDVIYLCQGTGETYSYTDETGTSVSSVRRVIFSDPIVGKNVKKYVGKAYTAKAEKTASVTLTGLTPVVGTEYIIRIVYKDIKEHPGQFTQTYRYISTTTDLDTFGAALAAVVNSHKGRRVTASYTAGTDVFLLTGLPIPECTTGLTDIDVFSMVDFEVFFVYVDSNGKWVTMPSTSTTVTYSGPTYGSGNWEQIRDLEKEQLGYVGVKNNTLFPVLQPTFATTKSKTYNVIVIEHDKEYKSPDNQYNKTTELRTILALEVVSSGNQTANILARLNPWMEYFGHDSIIF